MKRLIILLQIFLISACFSFPTTPITTPIPTDIPTTSTIIPDSLNTGYIKTTLEVVREGKVYEVVISYDTGDGFRYGAPKLEYPNWIGTFPQSGYEEIHWANDLDNDGEIEFIIELSYCGASCASVVQVYDYDKRLDTYRVFDEFYGSLSEEYSDINKDGNPEIISKDLNVFSHISQEAFSPIIIYQYIDNEIKTVTRDYPSLIEEDVKHWIEGIKSDGWGQGAGVVAYALAPYLYNMYLLEKIEEGNKSFQNMCLTYIKPNIGNPDWNCEEYFLLVQELIFESQEFKEEK